jgi:hypothetical protein
MLQEAIVFYLKTYRMTFYGVPKQSSWQLWVDVGLLCDKAAVLGYVIKGTLPSIEVFTA